MRSRLAAGLDQVLWPFWMRYGRKELLIKVWVENMVTL